MQEFTSFKQLKSSFIDTIISQVLTNNLAVYSGLNTETKEEIFKILLKSSKFEAAQKVQKAITEDTVYDGRFSPEDKDVMNSVLNDEVLILMNKTIGKQAAIISKFETDWKTSIFSEGDSKVLRSLTFLVKNASKSSMSSDHKASKKGGATLDLIISRIERANKIIVELKELRSSHYLNEAKVKDLFSGDKAVEAKELYSNYIKTDELLSRFNLFKNSVENRGLISSINDSKIEELLNDLKALSDGKFNLELPQIEDSFRMDQSFLRQSFKGKTISIPLKEGLIRRESLLATINTLETNFESVESFLMDEKFKGEDSKFIDSKVALARKTVDDKKESLREDLKVVDKSLEGSDLGFYLNSSQIFIRTLKDVFEFLESSLKNTMLNLSKFVTNGEDLDLRGSFKRLKELKSEVDSLVSTIRNAIKESSIFSSLIKVSFSDSGDDLELFTLNGEGKTLVKDEVLPLNELRSYVEANINLNLGKGVNLGEALNFYDSITLNLKDKMYLQEPFKSFKILFNKYANQADSLNGLAKPISNSPKCILFVDDFKKASAFYIKKSNLKSERSKLVQGEGSFNLDVSKVGGPLFRGPSETRPEDSSHQAALEVLFGIKASGDDSTDLSSFSKKTKRFSGTKNFFNSVGKLDKVEEVISHSLNSFNYVNEARSLDTFDTNLVSLKDSLKSTDKMDFSTIKSLFNETLKTLLALVEGLPKESFNHEGEVSTEESAFSPLNKEAIYSLYESLSSIFKNKASIFIPNLSENSSSRLDELRNNLRLDKESLNTKLKVLTEKKPIEKSLKSNLQVKREELNSCREGMAELLSVKDNNKKASSNKTYLDFQEDEKSLINLIEGYEKGLMDLKMPELESEIGVLRTSITNKISQINKNIDSFDLGITSNSLEDIQGLVGSNVTLVSMKKGLEKLVNDVRRVIAKSQQAQVIRKLGFLDVGILDNAAKKLNTLGSLVRNRKDDPDFIRDLVEYTKNNEGKNPLAKIQDLLGYFDINSKDFSKKELATYVLGKINSENEESKEVKKPKKTKKSKESPEGNPEEDPKKILKEFKGHSGFDSTGNLKDLLLFKTNVSTSGVKETKTLLDVLGSAFKDVSKGMVVSSIIGDSIEEDSIASDATVLDDIKSEVLEKYSTKEVLESLRKEFSADYTHIDKLTTLWEKTLANLNSTIEDRSLKYEKNIEKGKSGLHNLRLELGSIRANLDKLEKDSKFSKDDLIKHSELYNTKILKLKEAMKSPDIRGFKKKSDSYKSKLEVLGLDLVESKRKLKSFVKANPEKDIIEYEIQISNIEVEVEKVRDSLLSLRDSFLEESSVSYNNLFEGQVPEDLVDSDIDSSFSFYNNSLNLLESDKKRVDDLIVRYDVWHKELPNLRNELGKKEKEIPVNIQKVEKEISSLESEKQATEQAHKDLVKTLLKEQYSFKADLIKAKEGLKAKEDLKVKNELDARMLSDPRALKVSQNIKGLINEDSLSLTLESLDIDVNNLNLILNDENLDSLIQKHLDTYMLPTLTSSSSIVKFFNNVMMKSDFSKDSSLFNYLFSSIKNRTITNDLNAHKERGIGSDLESRLAGGYTQQLDGELLSIDQLEDEKENSPLDIIEDRENLDLAMDKEELAVSSVFGKDSESIDNFKKGSLAHGFRDSMERFLEVLSDEDTLDKGLEGLSDILDPLATKNLSRFLQSGGSKPLNEIKAIKKVMFKQMKSSGLKNYFNSVIRMPSIIGQTNFELLSEKVLANEITFVKVHPLYVLVRYFIMSFFDQWLAGKGDLIVDSMNKMEDELLNNVSTMSEGLTMDQFLGSLESNPELETKFLDLYKKNQTDLVHKISNVSEFSSFLRTNLFNKVQFMKAIYFLNMPYTSNLKEKDGKLYLVSTGYHSNFSNMSIEEINSIVQKTTGESEDKLYIKSASSSQYIYEVDFAKGISLNKVNPLYSASYTKLMNSKDSTAGLIPLLMKTIAPLFKQYFGNVFKGATERLNLNVSLNSLISFSDNWITAEEDNRNSEKQDETVSTKMFYLQTLERRRKSDPDAFVKNKKDFSAYKKLLKKLDVKDYDSYLAKYKQGYLDEREVQAELKLKDFNGEFIEVTKRDNISLGDLTSLLNRMQVSKQQMLEDLTSEDHKSLFVGLIVDLEGMVSVINTKHLINRNQSYTRALKSLDKDKDLSFEDISLFIEDTKKGYFENPETLIKYSKYLKKNDLEDLYSTIENHFKIALKLSDKDSLIKESLETHKNSLKGLQESLKTLVVTEKLYNDFDYNPEDLLRRAEALTLKKEEALALKETSLSQLDVSFEEGTLKEVLLNTGISLEDYKRTFTPDAEGNIIKFPKDLVADLDVQNLAVLEDSLDLPLEKLEDLREDLQELNINRLKVISRYKDSEKLNKNSGVDFLNKLKLSLESFLSNYKLERKILMDKVKIVVLEINNLVASLDDSDKRLAGAVLATSLGRARRVYDEIIKDIPEKIDELNTAGKNLLSLRKDLTTGDLSILDYLNSLGIIKTFDSLGISYQGLLEKYEGDFVFVSFKKDLDKLLKQASKRIQKELISTRDNDNTLNSLLGTGVGKNGMGSVLKNILDRFDFLESNVNFSGSNLQKSFEKLILTPATDVLLKPFMRDARKILISVKVDPKTGKKIRKRRTAEDLNSFLKDSLSDNPIIKEKASSFLKGFSNYSKGFKRLKPLMDKNYNKLLDKAVSGEYSNAIGDEKLELDSLNVFFGLGAEKLKTLTPERHAKLRRVSGFSLMNHDLKNKKTGLLNTIIDSNIPLEHLEDLFSKEGLVDLVSVGSYKKMIKEGSILPLKSKINSEKHISIILKDLAQGKLTSAFLKYGILLDKLNKSFLSEDSLRDLDRIKVVFRNFSKKIALEFKAFRSPVKSIGKKVDDLQRLLSSHRGFNSNLDGFITTREALEKESLSLTTELSKLESNTKEYKNLSKTLSKNKKELAQNFKRATSLETKISNLQVSILSLHKELKEFKEESSLDPQDNLLFSKRDLKRLKALGLSSVKISTEFKRIANSIEAHKGILMAFLSPKDIKELGIAHKGDSSILKGLRSHIESSEASIKQVEDKIIKKSSKHLSSSDIREYLKSFFN